MNLNGRQDKESEKNTAARLRALLVELYELADKLYSSGDYDPLRNLLGGETFDLAWRLGETQHAARGVALTLCAYKCLAPEQDIRSHKSDQPGGFSARSFDSSVTVPVLQERSLPYNVETHWLSQTFSFAGQYVRGISLKTVPKSAGPEMLELVNRVQDLSSVEKTRAVVLILLSRLIDERNKGRVSLEKPKNLTIEEVVQLLTLHFESGYVRNAPRLPQLGVYAMYSCIIPAMNRYAGTTLGKLERMKAANRKSGTVGDIDVNLNGKPIEAVEVKFAVPITRDHVSEAIQKIKTASVERYFILSTGGIQSGESETIAKLRADFKRANGCEIVVNGVLETLSYYLRLIRSTNDFIVAYAALVETDLDLHYEHRLRWNELCSQLRG